MVLGRKGEDGRIVMKPNEDSKWNYRMMNPGMLVLRKVRDEVSDSKTRIEKLGFV